jgi:hypothetical protein
LRRRFAKPAELSPPAFFELLGGFMHDQKDFRFEIKAVDEQGVFTGLAAAYGNVDDGDDLIEAGAFTKTLKEEGNTRPLLWQHKADVPIGSIALIDSPEGLRCTGKLLLQIDDAKKAYVLMKAKIVKGLSIGFQSVRDNFVGQVRHLKEIKLFEVSLVTLPMNQLAVVEAVKHRARDEEGEAMAIIALIRRDVARLTS